MSNKEKIKYSTDPIDWILRAAEELDAAEHLFKTMYPKPLEVITGLCQQCAEKSVKSVYLALENYKNSYPTTHDVKFLLIQIKNYVKYDKMMLEKGAYLTIFKTKRGYPAHIEEIDEGMAKKGIEYAKEIHKWAKEVVYGKNHIIRQQSKDNQR